MDSITSIDQIDLTPAAGKTYFSIDREWREEFIYFLLIDRFHDGAARTAITQADRSHGFRTEDAFYGGTLGGITQNLDYIAGLGCTAIWLSPIFENNGHSYHGYDIANYLAVDSRFGTKQDLINLVNRAHGMTRGGQAWPMKVILDVVTNHSGNNWSYPGDQDYYYSNGARFPFGAWRRADAPVPTELRDAELYHRCGQITNYDAYPEVQLGDIASLKDYHNDDDAPGSRLINILIKAHCYWIREADVDGFRVDAVKHMGDVACARFCSNIREYAYSLGKRDFFLFGEAATPDDDIYNRYIGPNTSASGTTVFFGIDSLLDFRLAEGIWGDANNAPLRQVLLGRAGPQTLFNRLEAQRNRALNRGEIGRYLVAFVDNHDSFWQPDGRIGAIADDDQVIGAVGFLLCALGTPCIYYGTEQGFDGHGGDTDIREAMFDSAPGGQSLLNTDCRIYREIASIADVMRSSEPLRFGRIYYREISGDGVNFGLPYGTTYTLAFSRLLYGSEVVIAYNVANAHREDHIVVDADLHPDGSTLTYLYGGAGSVTVHVAPNGTHFVQLPLDAHRFVILR
jgi:glycosidase